MSTNRENVVQLNDHMILVCMCECVCVCVCERERERERQVGEIRGV